MFAKVNFKRYTSIEINVLVPDIIVLFRAMAAVCLCPISLENEVLQWCFLIFYLEQIKEMVFVCVCEEKQYPRSLGQNFSLSRGSKLD